MDITVVKMDDVMYDVKIDGQGALFFVELTGSTLPIVQVAHDGQGDVTVSIDIDAEGNLVMSSAFGDNPPAVVTYVRS